MPPALLYEAPACFGGVIKCGIHLVCLVFVFLNKTAVTKGGTILNLVRAVS